MECYEGATMIKSFRGLIPDGGQDPIVLHTNDGSTGYKIVKLQGMANTPGVTSGEHVIKIYKVEQPGIDAVVDLSDNTLIAVLYFVNESSISAGSNLNVIIADNEIFNQDIYVTHATANAAGTSGNYYIELEQVKLDLNESTVATLKDVRNKELRTMIA